MPLDAVCLSGVVKELRESLLGLRVEKVQQPARDQVVLTLRGNKKLLLCAGANQARIHLTALSRENPAAPPMFCMLLRKHLTGGRITALTQPPMERIAELTVETSNEMGDKVSRRLLLEATGRKTNLLLLDETGRIADCLRRSGGDLTQARPLLPGMFYNYPPAQEGKVPPTDLPEGSDALAPYGPDTPADKLLRHGQPQGLPEGRNRKPPVLDHPCYQHRQKGLVFPAA